MTFEYFIGLTASLIHALKPLIRAMEDKAKSTEEAKKVLYNMLIDKWKTLYDTPPTTEISNYFNESINILFELTI